MQSGAQTRVCILPADPDYGLRYALGYAAADGPVLASVPVPATLETISNRDRCLCVEGNGTVITNVEHMNAVLFALGIDNATVLLHKPGLWPRLFARQALPLCADSTEGFVAAVDDAGTREQAVPRRARTVDAPVEFRDTRKGDYVRVEPAQGLTVTCTAGYEHLGVEEATLTFAVTADGYREMICRARTLMNVYARIPLGLLRVGAWFAYPRYGLGSGISTESMLVMADGRQVGEPRYGGTAAEFVRHKVMDFLGALALVGPLMDCHFTVVKSSHRHDLAFLRSVRSHLCPAIPAAVPAM